MNIERFIGEREKRWQQLERLVDEVEKLPDARIGHERIRELVTLYRETCSDLNRARSYTANPDLLTRLNQLTGRAYRFIYRGGEQKPIREAFASLVIDEIPRTFRRERIYVLSAAAAFLFGALVGLIAVLFNPANGQRLIPAEFFTESPRERVERIERDDERIDDIDKAAAFGAYLYTHNIQVTILAFSLGALTLVGGYWILFYNGVILGAVAAMYYLDGVQVFFFAWVGPHGALELPSIVFGGAAGIRAGHALLFPGDLSRASSLREAFPSIWRMMLGTALILVCAGIIEGSFSQFTSKSFPYPLKIGVSIVLFLLLMVYLFFRRGSADESIGAGETPAVLGGHQ